MRIEAADRLLRARMPVAAKPAALLRPAAARPAAAAVSCGSGAGQPVEIATLAASLKCDPDLIFEYVYNNIEYEPLFGSNKGALGTLLDLRGSDIDQAQLFTALLSAAGFPSAAINYQYGYIRLNGAQASGWLGVANDGQAIANLFTSGGIPLANAVVNPDGTLNSIDVAHVWVQLQINGTSYVFDPSYKQHAVSAGIGNLGAVLGYSQSQFLADVSGAIDGVSIWNVNRPAARADLATYAENLVAYIKSQNPAWTLADIVGGKTIEYLTGSPLRQTGLPYLSPSQPAGFPQNWGAAVPNAYRTCFTISMPGVPQTLCSAPSSQTIQLYSDQTYGHRITIFSTGAGCAPPSGSCTPTLLIDGAPPPNGQNTGAAQTFGQPWTVNVAIMHPYAGTLATAANQSGGLTIDAGGSYLIGAGWGQVGRGMAEKHRALLAQALAAGNAAGSEPVLGESLAVISYTWLAECAAVQRLNDGIAQLTTQYHHGLGITAQAAIQGQSGTQGPYVDLPLNFLTMQPQAHYTGTGFAPGVIGAFYTDSGTSSALESAVLEQTQALVPGMQAASTVRLVDVNLATGAKTYFADGTTSAGVQVYFNTIRPNLTGYSAADLNFIDYAISTTGTSAGNPTGQQALLPANGNIAVGLWTGAGYTVSNQQSTQISILQKISGGLSGGFSGNDVSPSTVASSTQTEMQPAAGKPAIPAGATAKPPAASDPTASEPVDAVTGAYLYRHDDLTTGSGGFPYALSFGRTYSSAAAAVDLGLGNGWAHTYGIGASRTSDPYAGLGGGSPIGAPAAIAGGSDMGENSAINAAAAIAAVYVSQDLLNGLSPKNAQFLTAAWLVNRWLTDQLTNNAVLVSWPGTSEEFTLLPHADGAASLAYNPPLGSAVVLTGSAPDPYGNPTVFTYRTKDRTQIAFNPIGAAAGGQIASWIFPYGVSLGFAYNYSYNGASYLTSVANNLGRSLTLAYSGPHVISVTDDAGRRIAYGYNGNDLASASDPLRNQTTFAYDGAGRLTRIFYPAQPANPFVTNTYDALGRVSQQANAAGNATSFFLAGSRSEVIDAAGDRHVTFQTPGGRILKDAWVLSGGFGEVFNDTPPQSGAVTVASYQYDGLDRLILSTLPEGGTIGYAYSPDLEQNVIQVTRTAKPGSPLAPLVTSYAYDPLYNKPTRITDPLGLVTSFGYDPATGNLLTAVADAGGGHFNARSSYTYNNYGQVLTATDPLGTVTTYAYDGFGNPTTIVRDAGAGHLNQTTMMAYSPSGDVVSVTDPNGNVTSSAYDADRRLTQVGAPPAPFPLVTAFTYDPDGRLLATQKSVNGAVLATTGASYTLTGKLASATDADGNVTRYAYDLADRLAGVTDAAGRVTNYTYDALSRPSGTFNPAIQAGALLNLGYTADGGLASSSDAAGHTTSYLYDGFDRLSTTTYPDSSSESLSYDADGNLLTRQTRRGNTITFTYDTLNRLASKAAPNEPAVTYAYDLVGHVTGISDTSAAIAAPAASASYTTDISYDALNRPITVAWSPAPGQTPPAASGASFTFAYDPTNRQVGQSTTDSSWWSYPSGASALRYNANNLNQYTAVGAATPSYDGDGNLTYDGVFAYAYDADGRLTAITQSGTPVASYAYDAQGRRKSKTAGGATTILVTDADNRTVLEYDGTSGAIARWYAYGLGPDAVLNQMNVAAGTRETLIPDIQGSIIGLLDSGTGTLNKGGYQPFGENPAVLSGVFRYTGHRFDSEAAGSSAQPSGLYDYRARIYSPTLGRFLQPDPIGYAGGGNLYAYVGNDPLNAIDPFGLDTQYSIGVGGTAALFVLGAGGSISVGINVPNNPLNLGGYQLLATGQANGMAGGGAYAGYGLSVSRSTTNGPLPVASGSVGWYAEGDIGYGASVSGSIQGNANGVTGGSISPLLRVGEGYGFWVGIGGHASGTLATPTAGQIYNTFMSLITPTAYSSSPGAPNVSTSLSPPVGGSPVPLVPSGAVGGSNYSEGTPAGK